MRASLCLAAVALVCACAPPVGGDAGPRADGGGHVADAGPVDTGYPTPRADLVPSVGGDDTLEIATWNIENFPALATTPSTVADLITSLGLDLIAVEEIADVAAFEELVQRLPRHAGALSSHEYSDGSYQKVGFIYREDLLEISSTTLLFSGAGYQFPRPPLQARFAVKGSDVDFTAIAVHLKAGLGSDDTQRRTEAIETLAEHAKGMVSGPADDEVVLLGDFNETVTNSYGRAVFAALLDDVAFRHQTANLANAGTVTYLPSDVMLDHIVTTAEMDDELAGTTGAEVPSLHLQMAGYDDVSDHLPVVLSLPLE